MTISSDIFFHKFTWFVNELRSQGIRIGIRETEDALRVASLVGFEDREELKQALSAVFSGSQRDEQVFSVTFDNFFVPQDLFEERQKAIEEAAQYEEEQRRLSEEELRYNGKPIDLSDDLKEVYAHMSREDKDKLLEYTERFKEAGERSPDLYDGFIRSIFMRSLMEQQMVMEDAAERAKGLDSDADLLFRELSNFREEEFPKVYALIDRLTRQITGEINARRRAGAHSAQLDFKKTIRRGLSAGGTFRKLYYKTKHQKKKHIIMLCDVSASMLQFSEFVIRFMKSMSDISERADIFLFSENVQKIGAFALENMDLFANYVRHSGAWGKGTNIGRAIEVVDAIRPAILDPASVLLILSDAKTVDLARAEVALEHAKSSVGSVIWLNPIPNRKWPYLKGITVLSQHCTMIPCSTLSELSQACTRLL